MPILASTWKNELAMTRYRLTMAKERKDAEGERILTKQLRELELEGRDYCRRLREVS